MKMHKLLMVALACFWSVGAFAQWQWLDKDGRKVFSDRPPPQEIPEKSILKQPRSANRATATATEVDPAARGTSAPAAAAGTPRPLGKDKELEEKKAQAEAAEAARKKAEEDKHAAARADNCTRVRQAKATIDSGIPLKQTNAQGEQGFLDEAGRAAETRRLQAIIDSDCKR